MTSEEWHAALAERLRKEIAKGERDAAAEDLRREPDMKPPLEPLRLDRNSTIARRLALGCMLPAALTPRADYSHRWGHVKAAAGAIAAISCLGSIDPAHADQMVADVEEAFRLLCIDMSGSAEDPRDVARIWDQHEELFDGLRLRVAERLSLLTAETPADIERALAGIAAHRESRR